MVFFLLQKQYLLRHKVLRIKRGFIFQYIVKYIIPRILHKELKYLKRLGPLGGNRVQFTGFLKNMSRV